MRASILLFLAACTSPLSDPTSLVDTPRVLAVRADPPEAEAGGTVDFTALYADASGALSDAPLDWSFCTSPRPLAELGPVASSCLDAGSADLADIGTGLTVTATLPDDGCSRFGPSAPPAEEGETSGGRPTDPDVTGGYYQPAVTFLDGELSTLVAARLRCGLANVTQETYVAWNTRYHDNVNPEIAGLTLDAGDGPVEVPADGAGTPPVVKAGAAVELGVGWAECPAEGECGDGVCSADEDLESCPDDCTTPVGCGGAESYVVWDAVAGELTTRREAISATWFTTGGDLALARAGRSGEESEASVADTWTAPDAAGEVWLGVVLRDERGGVTFGGYRVEVE